MAEETVVGELISVNGPLVRATGMSRAAVGDQAKVGDINLIGEIIAVHDEMATIQVYEDTTGLKPRMQVVSLGRPLSVELGPGLIGTTFDGIQRPLEALAEATGDFIGRGVEPPALDRKRKWHFVPNGEVGGKVGPLAIIGEVEESEVITHRIMLPPDVGGELVELAPEGDYDVEQVIARVRDDRGVGEVRMYHRWPIRRPRPVAGRLAPRVPLITGQRVLDFLFPVARGGAAVVPGGFGTGKTVVQHQLAKWSDADMIVYIGCGERGNEMTQILEEFPTLSDPRTGKPLTQRTVLIANTSNMPVMAREASIYTGMTIAEYYRDMGYNVAVMADSTSRWAEALREISGRMEEMPAEEGYPAYLASRLGGFYERAGRVEMVDGREGSVTIVGAVSPQGGDFSEPVTQHTQRFARTLWALDKELAGRRHFPSVNWMSSYSGYADNIAAWWSEQGLGAWADLRGRAMSILQSESRLERIAKLVGADALPDSQRLLLELGRLIRDGFLQQNAFDPIDSFCTAEKQIRMMELILHFYDRARHILEGGAPALTIMELDCVTRLVRMKSAVPNDDLGVLDEIARQVDEELDELAERYGLGT
jgi:V/A-type H+-transporting ATPase subunit A